jgi:hypothetical protein
LNECLKFDTLNKKIEMIGELNVERSDPGVIEFGRYLYVFGGRNTIGDHVDYIERINI